MGLINQWEDVTSLECNVSGNSTCLKTGDDILKNYGFDKVCQKDIFFSFKLSIYFRAIIIVILVYYFFFSVPFKLVLLLFYYYEQNFNEKPVKYIYID